MDILLTSEKSTPPLCWLTVANAFTTYRAVIGCLFIFLDLTAFSANAWLILIITAGLSDFFDGWAARTWQQSSAFGKLYDPLADALLINGSLIALTPYGYYSRFFITALWIRYTCCLIYFYDEKSRGVVYTTPWLGKVFAGAIMLHLALSLYQVLFFAPWHDYHFISYWLLWLGLIISWFSYYRGYIKRFKKYT